MKPLQWGVLALLLGVLLASLSHRVRAVRTPEHGDQDSYLSLAANLREGRGFVSDTLSPFKPIPQITHPESVRAPLYPLLLATVVTREIEAYDRARYLTLFMSLAFLAAAFFFIRREDGFPIALGFVFLLARNAPFRTYSTELWAENLFLCFAFPGLLALRRAFRESLEPGPRWAGAAGILLGLSWLTKTYAALVLVAALGATAFSLLGKGPKRGRIIFGAVLSGSFLVTIVPYLTINLVNTGVLTRDVDLQGAFWLEHGWEYWFPHEAKPTFLTYLQEHGLPGMFDRLIRGTLAQGGNLLDACSFEGYGGRILPLILLLPACWSLLLERIRGWRIFQLLFLILNLLIAGWYSRIDVTPRFINLLVPLLYLNATIGIVDLIHRLAGTTLGRFRIQSVCLPLAMLALPLLLDVYQASQPISGPGAVLTESEEAVLAMIHRVVPPDQVLAIGPTHAFPFLWLIHRRNVFIPDYENWEMVLKYLETYEARAILLDPQLFYRRRRIFEGYFSLDRVTGLNLVKPIPGTRAIFRDSGRPIYWLLAIVE